MFKSLSNDQSNDDLSINKKFPYYIFYAVFTYKEK